MDFIVNRITELGSGAKFEGADIPSEWESVEIQISSAQLLAGNLGIEILSAPGANKYFIVDYCTVQYIFNTSDYTYTAAEIKINNIEYPLSAFLFNWGGNAAQTVRSGTEVNAGTDPEQVNIPLTFTIQNGLGAPTGGDGKATIKIRYKIETIG